MTLVSILAPFPYLIQEKVCMSASVSETLKKPMEEFTVDASKNGYVILAIAYYFNTMNKQRNFFQSANKQCLVKTSTSSKCKYEADSERGMSA